MKLEKLFADRIGDVPKSFIREILKVTLDPSVISFAGGLPNRELFPVEQLKNATCRAFADRGTDVLQYAETEGDVGLREYISELYRSRNGMDISIDDVLITSGSQQGLDLLGKTLVNEGDGVIIEEPGYLGAIQAFSLYRPKFLPVPVSQEGMDVDCLSAVLSEGQAKLLYTVPNFQNPSGVSYPEQNRHDLAAVLEETDTLLIEDDPYGELRFSGCPKSSFGQLLPNNTVLLGSFSKTLVPGLRLGWLVAPDSLMSKLVTAKQATDLHTSHFTQSIVLQYLRDNDIGAHIRAICDAYGNQCRAMLASIQNHFPKEVSCTQPEGGMFLWAELPSQLAALELFELAAREKVVFVPGDPFYVRGSRHSTMRLNFSCADPTSIDIGIAKLGKAIRELAARAEQVGRP